MKRFEYLNFRKQQLTKELEQLDQTSRLEIEDKGGETIHISVDDEGTVHIPTVFLTSNKVLDLIKWLQLLQEEVRGVAETSPRR